MDAGIITFLAARLPELWLRTGEHVLLTGFSTGIAILTGIPLGIMAFRLPRLRSALLGSIGILQTIPSLAMLAILLALLHRIGVFPAIIALTLYALLPIVRNTLTGLESVPGDVTEAATGIGMNSRQRLWIVQMPLALPVIIAGIRTSAVVGVGIATLSAFIGAGGLGQFINRGLALSNTRLILLGAIPAALLALLVDFVIAAAGWGLNPKRKAARGTLIKSVRYLACSLPVIIFAVGALAWYSAHHGSGGAIGPASGKIKTAKIRIGSKNFTEQIILGEIMARMIESHTGLSVERVFNLGGTMICHKALVEGEIDIYPEYTGTGLTAVLKRKPVGTAEETLAAVRAAYRERFHLEWMPPFGFNNTYAMGVRTKDARKHGWRTISDISPWAVKLRAGFTAEFCERPDGYPGLSQMYGLKFGKVKDLDPGLMYQAVAKDEVDVICAFATDGRVTAYGLKLLKDNKGFFPPYHSAPVIRKEILAAYPEIEDALSPLFGSINDSIMRMLNYQVDVSKYSPEQTAVHFLQKHKGISKN